MRLFSIASVALALVIFGFLGGILTGAGGLMMMSFCLWSPAIGFWGFSIGRLRLRLVLDDPRKTVRR